MWRWCREQLLVRVVMGLFVAHMLLHLIVFRWPWSGLRASLNPCHEKASVQREIVVFPTDLALRRYQMEQALADGFCRTAGTRFDVGSIALFAGCSGRAYRDPIFGFECFGT